jgi:hypothetical protein
VLCRLARGIGIDDTLFVIPTFLVPCLDQLGRNVRPAVVRAARRHAREDAATSVKPEVGRQRPFEFAAPEVQQINALFRSGFRVNMWGTSSPGDKLTGDFGNEPDTTLISDRGLFRLLAGNLSPGVFRLLQHNREKSGRAADIARMTESDPEQP